jgi:hypothetical protein
LPTVTGDNPLSISFLISTKTRVYHILFSNYPY